MTHDFKAGRSWESPLNCMPSEDIRLHFTCDHFTGTRNFKFWRAYIFDWVYTNYFGPLWKLLNFKNTTQNNVSQYKTTTEYNAVQRNAI
jgi:hypothetical protein